MTLDETIKHAEEVAEEQEKAAREWHENQVRKCEIIPFAEMDYTHENECEECAKEHRQLAEWLKELKKLREQTRWIPYSEKPPKKNVEVLATTTWDAITIAEMYSANDWFIHEGTTNAETDEIVAWMSLPQPYKAESEEEVSRTC